MKKMSTLFVVNYEGRTRKSISDQVREENEWVFTEDSVKATRKFDGTACMINAGILYRRYDAKNGKTPPNGAIPCCEADTITGHHPHWIPCDRLNPRDKYHFEAFDSFLFEDGTYELIGEKLQGNPEKIIGHKLVKHGESVLDIEDWSFNGFKEFLSSAENDIEGIVFHGSDGKMCKLRKSDFGIKR